MSETTTLENVIEQVYRQSDNHYDEVIPVQEMKFDSIERMWVSGKQVEVIPSAQRLLANRLRAPHSYLARCPAHLQADNLNYWVRQEGKKRDTFFCRFDGDKLRAVFTERYAALDNMEILSRMLENGFSPSQEVQYRLDENLLVVKVPEYDRSFEVRALDKMVPGISFSNSEVGMLAFCIEVYFFRLVCSNGLIAKVKAGASRFKHISRKALDHFPETIAQTIQASRERRDVFQISVNTPVSNVEATLVSFNRQFGIGRREAGLVEMAWALEPGNTMFSVINAYTLAAQTPSLTAGEAYRLEKTAGQILSLVKH